MMRGVLEKIPDTTLTTAFSNNLELGGATTSKATALLELEKILGVKPEEMMAIGDSPNDMAMMELAGMPVAVGNAKPEVKAIAKYVSASNTEDGVLLIDDVVIVSVDEEKDEDWMEGFYMAYDALEK